MARPRRWRATLPMPPSANGAKHLRFGAEAAGLTLAKPGLENMLAVLEVGFIALGVYSGPL